MNNHWKEHQVVLRGNEYAGCEPKYEGAAVHLRISLKIALRGLLYKYVVDDKGEIWLLPGNLDFKHSSLVPIGTRVYSAGWIKIDALGSVHVNCDSGHYMAEWPLSEGPEIENWTKAITETIQSFGLSPGILYAGTQLLS